MFFLTKKIDVGNKAAVFPLQLLGFDVDVINSVHFSNHTGYPCGVQGDVLKGNQLRNLLIGLENNDLLHDIGHIVTGYIGSESFLEAVIDVVEHVRNNNNNKNNNKSNNKSNNNNNPTMTIDNNCPQQSSLQSSHVRYVCDPVLGDDGKFYVPCELVDVYRNRVIPLADVLTPNQFEVEQLTGIHIQTMQDAQQACQILHDMGPSLVIITSLITTATNTSTSTTTTNDKVEEREDKTWDENRPKRSLSILASQQQQQQQQQTPLVVNGTSSSSSLEMWSIQCPEIPGRFTGTGDLCAALLLAHTALRPNDLPGALEQVVDTMYAVIERTYQHSVFISSLSTTTKTTTKNNNNKDKDDNNNNNHQDENTTTTMTTPTTTTTTTTKTVAAQELQLIQSKQEIENPPQLFKAVRIQ